MVGRDAVTIQLTAETQDAADYTLVEQTAPIPSPRAQRPVAKGFSVIATANNRDRGVNELSSALRRRFNTVVLPVPASAEEEVEIVQRRVESLGRALELPAEPPALEEIRRIVTIFRELRNGVTTDGKTKLKSPSGTMSTAEAILVVNSDLAIAAHFGDGRLGAGDTASGIVSAFVKDL